MGQATARSRPGATAPITPNINSMDAKLDSRAAALALLVNVSSCRERPTEKALDFSDFADLEGCHPRFTGLHHHGRAATCRDPTKKD